MESMTKLTFKCDTPEEMCGLKELIHTQLVGNPDYIENNIILDGSDNLKDDKEYNVYLYIDKNISNPPDIVIPKNMYKQVKTVVNIDEELDENVIVMNDELMSLANVKIGDNVLLVRYPLIGYTNIVKLKIVDSTNKSGSYVNPKTASKIALDSDMDVAFIYKLKSNEL